MKFAFYFTLKCNAKCAHCITFAGPGVERKMTLEQALTTLRMIRQLEHFDGVVFTGGENFLHRDELLQLVQECRCLGLASEIISNGYWATSSTIACEILGPFKSAGLETLRISIDEYHLPFINRDRIHIALEAMRFVGLPRHITCAIQDSAPLENENRCAESDWDAHDTEFNAGRIVAKLRSHWPPALLTLLKAYAFDPEDMVLIDDVVAFSEQGTVSGGKLAGYLFENKILIQYQSVAPEGRGRDLMDRMELDAIERIPERACNSVGGSPTVNPEGNVFPCCSSWVNFPKHRIGNTNESPLTSIMNKMREDEIVLFMHYQGPRTLIEFLRRKGFSLPSTYSHPCHLCGTALENFSREELIYHIKQYYAEHPWRRLLTSRGLQLSGSAQDPFLPPMTIAVGMAPLSLTSARRFFGIYRPTGIRSGIRFEGSSDRFLLAFNQIGYTTESVLPEDCLDTEYNLVTMRTAGCVWTDVIPSCSETFNDESVAHRLSISGGCRAVTFRYDYENKLFSHALYERGKLLEKLDVPSSSHFQFSSHREGAPTAREVKNDIPYYLNQFFKSVRMRDWGITLADIYNRNFVFPPTALVSVDIYDITYNTNEA